MVKLIFNTFFYFVFLLGISCGVNAQSGVQENEDVNILLYEKTSRMGVVGDILGGLFSKNSVTGVISIDPFGLDKSSANRIVKICYVKQADKVIADEDLIAYNLKKTLGGDDSLFDRVGSDKGQFNTFSSFRALGLGLIKGDCDFIAVASIETQQINDEIKSIDEQLDKTYKPITGFKISSTKLWEKAGIGKPASKQEYLTSAWCGSPDASDSSALQKLNISTLSACKDAQKELIANGYSPNADYSAKKLVSYFNDKAEGKKTNLTAEQVRVARNRELELEKKKQFAARYPFYAVISCLDGGKDIKIPYCMFGQRESLNGEVKIQVDGRTKLYNHLDFEEIPNVINLSNKFTLVAQNASSYFILEVKIYNSLTGKQIFSDQVGKYGVINIGN